MQIKNLKWIPLALLLFSAAWSQEALPRVKADSQAMQEKFVRLNKILAGEGADGVSSLATGDKRGLGRIAVDMVLGLIAVILLLLLAIYLVRRLQQSRTVSGSRSRMRSVDSLHLGSGQRVMAVQVREKVLLLGVTQSTVNLLDQLEGDDARKFLENEGSDGLISPRQFSDTVSLFLERFRKSGVSSGSQGGN